MVVIGLGKNILFKSILAHCEALRAYCLNIYTVAWVIKDKERHEFATEKAVFLLHATPTDEVKTYMKSHEIFILFIHSNDFTTFFHSKTEQIS